MDWVTVVFIIIFFVLPVIQQILEAKRGRREEGDDGRDLEQDWEPIRTEGRVEDRSPARIPSGDSPRSTWSDGWGSWPEPIEVDAPADDRAPWQATPRETAPNDSRDREGGAPERPSRAERAEPTPSLPDRIREQVRPLPEVIGRTSSIEADQPRERSVVPTPRRPPRAPAAARPSGRPRPIAARLGSPAELRQAVLLREILGPPRALQSDDSNRAGPV